MESHASESRPRARDLGIKIGPLLSPGNYNAITDVPRVIVGTYEKVLDNETSTGEKRMVRAGVTVISTADIYAVPLYAGVDALQGTGELTGGHYINETGSLSTPIVITGTVNVGAVYNSIHKAEELGMFGVRHFPISLPVVAETYDRMSHPESFPIGDDDVFRAIKNLNSGPVKEGNTGGGTPMVSFGLKGGTGTSSRLVPSAAGGNFTVGVLVQANHGVPYDLTIAGVDIGRTLYEEGYTKPWFPEKEKSKIIKDGDGSVIAVIATDAPLLPLQCKAVARRAGVGISRGGGGSSIMSGDIFICFSTAKPVTSPQDPSYEKTIEPVSTYTIEVVNNETIDSIFRAAADATEEAIINALLAAEEMEGYSGRKWRTLPIERVKDLLRKAGRI